MCVFECVVVVFAFPTLNVAILGVCCKLTSHFDYKRNGERVFKPVNNFMGLARAQ